MIPVSVCLRVIVVVAAAVAGKEILSSKCDKGGSDEKKG